MDFIQTSNKQVDKFGAGKHGFSPGNPTSGILATLLSNTWCDGVQQEIINVIEGAGLTANPALLNQLLQAIGILAAGRLIGLRVYSATQVYSQTTGTKSIITLTQGAGGGGGGSQAAGAAQCASGSGGGGGGWAIKRITSGFNGSLITVGAAGAGGVIAPGSAGGTTSFGAFCTGPGGDGGSLGNVTSNTSTLPNGFANSGIGTGGDYNGQGGYGGFALYSTNPVSGKGGNSYFGEGGIWRTGYATGGNALVPGAGGGGGNTPASNGGATGGNGGPGLCLVWEHG